MSVKATNKTVLVQGLLFGALLVLFCNLFLSTKVFAQSASDICGSRYDDTSQIVQCELALKRGFDRCYETAGPGSNSQSGTTIEDCRQRVIDEYFTPKTGTPLPSLQRSVSECDLRQSVLGIPTWYKYLPAMKETYSFQGKSDTGNCTPVLSRAEYRNDEGEVYKEVDINAALPIGLAVLEAAMTIAGFVAVVMIFYASFLYLTTRGEADKATAARKTVINAVIGLVIIIVATRVVSFLATRLTS